MTANAFSVEHDGRLAVLTFDLPNEPVNTLTRSVGVELLDRLADLRADDSVGAIVLISGKPGVFIAGADVKDFAALESAEGARRLSSEGQRLMNEIAASKKPVVAAIHGACLGGGLELVMAAHYRVASDAPATKLGLPEVKLGIIPGAGGCQRLPRMVGLRAALDLILTGRSLTPARAKRMGLVDEVVPLSILRRVAGEAGTRLAGAWQPPARGAKGIVAFLLEKNPIGRGLVFRRAKSQVMKRTAGHYPAPLAALEAVRLGLAHGMAAGLEREADLFAELAVGDVSRRLVEIFFATTSLKKDVGVDLRAPEVRTVERLGMVGAGFMGAAIAGVAVGRAGVDVRLRDTDAERVARGIISVRKSLGDARRRRDSDRHEAYRRAALVSGSTDYSGFGRRDLVIEAVVEDLEVKRAVIAEVEEIVTDVCVVASNTSTLPIGRLQQGARRPERIVGMHFFSPVEKMPLVEIIRGPATADWAVATAARFGQQMGKTAIVIRDAPGFWVNRILAPYLNEAGWLLKEGASIKAVDRVMTKFGFPVGPFALMDEVGLDIAAKASVVLHDAFGERLAPAPAVAALVHEGRLGRKSGGGFYSYVEGKRTSDSSVEEESRESWKGPFPDTEIERRLVLAMTNEAARAFSEGVVGTPRDGDIGAIFGFGFPAFLGGPLRYLDARGADETVAELERCATIIGPRFAPADLLLDIAKRGGTFYEDRS